MRFATWLLVPALVLTACQQAQVDEPGEVDDSGDTTPAAPATTGEATAEAEGAQRPAL